MKRSLLTLSAITFGLHFLGATANAQLVQVGPGYVKAPFVRVYTDPSRGGGGAYVRAPFVEVNGSGPRGGRVMEQVAPPSPEELSQLDWRTLRLTIRELSNYLDSQLSSQATGDQWKVRLKTAEIRALVRDENAPPSEQVLAQLPKILAIYEETAQNPAYRVISGFDGFRSLNDALIEFAAPPDLRIRKQLFMASSDLNQALANIGAEAAWQRLLALPEGLALPPDAAPQGNTVVADEVAKTLARYDSIARNSQYRAIASIPAFRAVHERLGEYLALPQAESSGPRLGVEELPAPRPVR